MSADNLIYLAARTPAKAARRFYAAYRPYGRFTWNRDGGQADRYYAFASAAERDAFVDAYWDKREPVKATDPDLRRYIAHCAEADARDRVTPFVHEEKDGYYYYAGLPKPRDEDGNYYFPDDGNYYRNGSSL